MAHDQREFRPICPNMYLNYIFWIHKYNCISNKVLMLNERKKRLKYVDIVEEKKIIYMIIYRIKEKNHSCSIFYL